MSEEGKRRLLSKDVSAFVKTGGELPLSNRGQVELLRGITERGKSFRLRVLGSSMSPFIRDNDILTLAPIHDRPPDVGDVVAFVRPETGWLRIHRIIGRQHDGWLLRGDNCPESDGIFRLHEIVGRVTRIERNGGAYRFGQGSEARLIAWFQRAGVLL